MLVLIVGGDHLGSIPRQLTRMGATRIIHLSGRDQAGFRNGLPKNIDLIIVLCDYANHGITKRVKSLARSMNVPILFSKRSWSSISQKLSMSGLTEGLYWSSSNVRFQARNLHGKEKNNLQSDLWLSSGRSFIKV